MNHRQKTTSFIVWVMSILIWVIIGTACDPGYEDLSTSLPVEKLSTPKANYINATWLDNDLLVLKYEDVSMSRSPQAQLSFFNLPTGDLIPFPFEKPPSCMTGWFGVLKRLPTGHLGFMYICSKKEDGLNRQYHTLYVLDSTDNSIRPWRRYPTSFGADDYSFAPDARQMIQERSGDGIYNRLYRVEESGDLQEILVNFWRAGSPSWSPDGETIAFTGTKERPTERTSVLTGLVSLGNRLFYPWNIYSMDAQGANVKIVLSDVIGANALNWSPNGEWLSFRGEWKNKSGIWMINEESKRVIRIWPRETAYDWSPSGHELILIDYLTEIDSLGREFEYGFPVIVDLTTITE